MEIEFTPFEPESATENEWDQLFTIRNEYMIEIIHDFVPEPYELWKKYIKRTNPYVKEARWLVHLDKEERAIGSAYYIHETEKSPSYETNRHVANIRILIDSNHRRIKIGVKTLEFLVRQLSDKGISIIHCPAPLESSQNFCEKFGGTKALAITQSHLKMKNVDWEMIKNWREEGSVRAEGVEIKRFNDVPENIIDEYCILFTEVVNQMPFGEIETRNRITPESRRMSEKKINETGDIWTTLITKEQNERISGLTDIFYNPADPEKVYQQLTGVKKEFRGRGLGKWLKAEMITIINKEFPTVKEIITSTATTNAPMLAINDRLGFKKQASGINFKFIVDDLLSKLSI